MATFIHFLHKRLSICDSSGHVYGLLTLNFTALLGTFHHFVL